MQIILLSGGSGKRLWPLSNEIRSKQFIKIFKSPEGKLESMVQRVHRQIKAVDPSAEVTIATSKPQVSAIHNQLGESVGISVEPSRRNTFPAIALAAAYLNDVKGVSLDEVVVVCPVDPYVEQDYFQALKSLSELASTGQTNLMLLGMEPTYPSEKYGYIIPSDKSHVSKVKTFKEKPTEKTAREYISQGALWNGGVFAFKLGYVLSLARTIVDFIDYSDLLSKYEMLPNVSFDYAVAENELESMVMRFEGSWKDLGTWNTLTESMDDPVIGNAVLNEECEDVHVVNQLSVPILCMGLKNIVVSASADGILVSDKEQSSYIKPYVENIAQDVMFAEKSWGEFQVLDISPKSLTAKITIRAGQRMNYHSHEHRSEIWTIVSGEGVTVVDGIVQRVKPGDVLTMQEGCRHTLIAETELSVIEVQIGESITKSDKKKFPLNLA